MLEVTIKEHFHRTCILLKLKKRGRDKKLKLLQLLVNELQIFLLICDSDLFFYDCEVWLFVMWSQCEQSYPNLCDFYVTVDSNPSQLWAGRSHSLNSNMEDRHS